MSRVQRLGLAAVALSAWSGLLLQLVASYRAVGALLDTLWLLAAFFTILTNLAVALVFTRSLATGRLVPHASAIAGVTAAIALVGIAYELLLRGTVQLAGLALLADTVLHDVTPLLALAFWLLLMPKGHLAPRDPWRWTTLPLAYLAYYLLRGALTGRFPYGFIDPTRSGWPQALLGALLVAALFLLLGRAMLALDRRLARPAA